MAVSFTAANSHLYCVGVNLPNSNSPYSINVWLRATWNGGGRLSFVGMYDGVPATGTPTTGGGLQIGTAGGAGDITCWTYGGTTMITSAAGVMTPRNGIWTMATYVWDGTNHRLYVDGAPVATPTTTAFTGVQMTQVYLDGYPPTGSVSETAAFSVDSYDAYNRALTPDEILAMYNSAGARNGIIFEHSCQYEFDEGIEGAVAGSNAGNAPVVVDMTGSGQPLLHTGGTNTTAYTYVGVFPNSNIRPVQ